jgi:hypothetical protein
MVDCDTKWKALWTHVTPPNRDANLTSLKHREPWVSHPPKVITPNS